MATWLEHSKPLLIVQGSELKAPSARMSCEHTTPGFLLVGHYVALMVNTMEQWLTVMDGIMVVRR